METPISEPVQVPNSVELNSEALRYLESIRKWTKFFAILGCIGIGLMVVLALTMGTILTGISNMANNGDYPFPTILFTIIYLLLAGAYVYPVVSLYKFSNSLGQMLENKESNMATEAFKHFNGHLRYIGVFTIIIMGLYALLFLFSIMGIFLR